MVSGEEIECGNPAPECHEGEKGERKRAVEFSRASAARAATVGGGYGLPLAGVCEDWLNVVWFHWFSISGFGVFRDWRGLPLGLFLP